MIKILEVFRTLESKKAEKYMFGSSSPVGMLNVKVDDIGILQETFKNLQLEKLRIQYDSNFNGIFRMKWDKLMHRLEID